MWEELALWPHVLSFHVHLHSPLQHLPCPSPLWSGKQQHVLSFSQHCVHTGHLHSLQMLQSWIVLGLPSVAALIWVSLASAAISFHKMCRSQGFWELLILSFGCHIATSSKVIADEERARHMDILFTT